MKILYIIDSLTSGGKERQMVELLKGIKSHNCIKTELVVLSDNIHYGYVYDLGIPVHIIRRKTKKDISIFKKLYLLCLEFKPEIIHSWDSMCSFYAIPVSKLLGIKFVNGIIRNSPMNFSFYKSRKWLLIKITFMLSDVNLSNSHAGIMAFKAPKHKSRVIYNGFDRKRLGAIRDEESVRNEYKLGKSHVVGMVARFDNNKDYFTYIKAALEILGRRQDVTFVAVGTGPNLPKCIDMVPAKFRENIRFLGRLNDVESLVNIFDVGVLSSSEDGISNAIMEFMALGKPVIATNQGGNAEIVLDHATGFLVGPNNPSALAEKIEYLLDRGDIAKSMGIAGEQRLATEFGLDKMTDAHIHLYRSCLDSGDKKAH